jgi:endonuclease/exonuclease/phosphatase (EEP) superfamily protein YafD
LTEPGDARILAARRFVMPGNPSTRWGTLLVAALALLAGCVTLTVDPRALIYEPAGVRVQTLPCPAAAQAARSAATSGDAGGAGALDPEAIRLVTWNIHKQSDAGWEADLGRFAAASDVLLLQEATLLDSLQRILRGAGLRWIMASSFIFGDVDIGVLTAARTAPVAACTQRVVEPLIRLPKSAVITWFALTGTSRTLAVANVHAINFSLSLDAYRTQLAALADVLAAHDGPIVLGGDLNTWTQDRAEVVRAIADRLNLAETAYAEDGRTRFFGNQVDHIFVRGLDVVAARTVSVTSSDHNPVEVLLRLAQRAN